MNKKNAMITISAAVIMSMILTASVLAAPATALTAFVEQVQQVNANNVDIFKSAFAAGTNTHAIAMTAEKVTNGQVAFKMASHVVKDSSGNTVENRTPNYASTPTMPGPTIFVRKGDTVQVTLTNNIPGTKVSFNVPGMNDGVSRVVNTGSSFTFVLNANQVGTYLYQDKKDGLLGLFGAIVVDPVDGKVPAAINGSIQDVNLNELGKEYVLGMIGSTFWGMEIDHNNANKQTAEWINPILVAKQDQKVRFHVISLGMAHTFHLHAHRWLDPGTTNIIDTKLLDTPYATHSFIVQAGENVGAGDWQYHCHVFAHMEAGMHSVFRVLSNAPTETRPNVSIAGNSPLVGHDAFGVTNAAVDVATFTVSDQPGTWFQSARGNALAPLTVSKSVEVILPGGTVNFVMSDTNTQHTITSLIYPMQKDVSNPGQFIAADHMPFDETTSYRGGATATLHTPGLYVFSCKIHPYMFASVIVQNPNDLPDKSPEPGLTLGEKISTDNNIVVPTVSDLALRLLRVFFIATTPSNWQTFSSTSDTTWNPHYPALPFIAYTDGGSRFQVADLNATMHAYFQEPRTLKKTQTPATPGVGEVWVDTQFEMTANKYKPGTATAVNATTWQVSKKVALPEQNMNNPHNMWTDKNQQYIYQTEWFDNKLDIFNRADGTFVSQVTVGDSPAHVQTRSDTDDLHVSLNGANGIAEILAGTTTVNRIIPMQGADEDPTHPHAHWMTHDGKKMVTPNAFTQDSTVYNFNTNHRDAKVHTGAHPIATGMMPDDSKYYVANFLDSTISVIETATGVKLPDISMLKDYLPTGGLTGLISGGDPLPGLFAAYPDGIPAVIGALPIQTPVSPDGKAMVTANTLTGTLVITNTTDNHAIKTLACDAGCHGVNFGAKQGGGYYAYVSSKFSNRMIVVDIDPDNDGKIADAKVVGSVILAASPSIHDDTVTALAGTGGQGVLAIPNVYNGWVQKIPDNNPLKAKLSPAQQNPYP